jgi:hypothetical protein
MSKQAQAGARSCMLMDSGIWHACFLFSLFLIVSFFPISYYSLLRVLNLIEWDDRLVELIWIIGTQKRPCSGDVVTARPKGDRTAMIFSQCDFLYLL